MFGIFKRVRELEARVAKLEQSTTDRFAVVMTSQSKMHGRVSGVHQANLALANRLTMVEELSKRSGGQK